MRRVVSTMRAPTSSLSAEVVVRNLRPDRTGNLHDVLRRPRARVLDRDPGALGWRRHVSPLRAPRSAGVQGDPVATSAHRVQCAAARVRRRVSLLSTQVWQILAVWRQRLCNQLAEVLSPPGDRCEFTSRPGCGGLSNRCKLADCQTAVGVRHMMQLRSPCQWVDSTQRAPGLTVQFPLG